MKHSLQILAVVLVIGLTSCSPTKTEIWLDDNGGGKTLSTYHLTGFFYEVAFASGALGGLPDTIMTLSQALAGNQALASLDTTGFSQIVADVDHDIFESFHCTIEMQFTSEEEHQGLYQRFKALCEKTISSSGPFANGEYMLVFPNYTLDLDGSTLRFEEPSFPLLRDHPDISQLDIDSLLTEATQDTSEITESMRAMLQTPIEVIAYLPSDIKAAQPEVDSIANDMLLYRSTIGEALRSDTVKTYTAEY